jgi:hypothetical protein
MLKLAAIKISDRGDTDVWMRAHIDAPTRDELGRPGLVEEDERSGGPRIRRYRGRAG